MAKKDVVKKSVNQVKVEDSNSKLLEVMKEINKGFKGRSPLKFASSMIKKPFIPTGIEQIDRGIGGGIPTGVSIVYGLEGSSKTTLCLHTIAQCQKLGKQAMYIDLERKLDFERATALGIDLEKLIYVNDCKYAEEALEMIRTISRQDVVDLIVLDSVSALSCIAEQESKKGVERGLDEDEMAIVAKKLSKFFRVVGNDLENGRPIHLLLVAQGRTNLGGFIAHTDLSGGNALKHYSKVTLEHRRGSNKNAPVAKIKFINEETGRENTRDEVLGFEVVIKVKKNHCSAEKRLNEGEEVHLPFYYSTGLIPPKDVVLVEKPIESEEVSDVAE